jgi:hypothetical protein
MNTKNGLSYKKWYPVLIKTLHDIVVMLPQTIIPIKTVHIIIGLI